MSMKWVGILELVAGAPFEVEFAASGDDLPDMTGFNFRLAIRNTLGAANIIVVCDSANSSATFNPATKTGVTALTAAQTRALKDLANDPAPSDKAALFAGQASFYHADGRVIYLGHYRVNWSPEIPA